MLKRLFFVSVMSCVGVSFQLPSAYAEIVLTAPQQSIVHRIEESLSKTDTFQARFEQVTVASGDVSKGTVLIARPGRMRFSYDPPSPLSVVANDGRVIFQDTSIDQTTTLPLERTPLSLLLRPNPRFSGDVTITDFQQKQGHIELKAVKTENPSEGELTLFFKARPLALQGWTVVDAQGRQTRIRLSDVHTGVAIDPKSFDLPKED